jgi:hypothetical protein
MHRSTMKFLVLAILVLALLTHVSGLAAACCAQGQTAASPYPTRAPLSEYLIADPQAEIALARTAAPPSISQGAEILVLGPTGYSTAVKGSNGFVCLVERAFAASTDFSEFFNPKNRSPNCVNAAAARTYLPTIFLRTKLVIEGRTRPEIAKAVSDAVKAKQLPALEPGAMAYMMSKEQYLNDQVIHWHPHLMWFVPAGAEKSWGANLDGSPIIAGNDSDGRVTIFMVMVGAWSDGSPAPAMTP